MGRIAWLVVTLLTALASVAAAGPLRINQQGRFLDDAGIPLSGSHELVFSLHDDEVSGAEIWSETQNLELDEGYYSVILGSTTPIDSDLLDGSSLWLQVVVDGTALSPRQEVLAVPYAGRATTAENLDGGTVNAVELLVGGTVVVDSAGNWVGASPEVSWNELLDTPAEFLDGDQDTLLELGCLAGEVARWDGVSWVCDTDLDTQLTEAQVDAFVANNDYSTGPHTVDTDTLAGLSCLPGEVPKWKSIPGFPGSYTWQCDTDLNTQLTETQVDAFVADNGYLTDQTIDAKPFLLRSTSGGHWAGDTSFTTVATLSPLQSGNHMTPSEIKLHGFKTSSSSSLTGSMRYVLNYADGTSYASPSEGVGYNNNYSHERTDTVPVHAGMRGSITTIDVQVSKGHPSTGWGVYGKVEVTGFETLP